MSPLDQKEFDKSREALRQVMVTAKDLGHAENLLEKGYAHLGWQMLEVQQMQYWRLLNNTFRDYVKVLALHAHKTPGQLQRYFLTVRDLSDTFDAEQLECIGITKALQLRQAKDYAIILPKSVIDAALDPKVTAKELKREIATTLKMPEEEGDWLDLEFEFLVTPEQRKFAEQVMASVMGEDPVIKSTIAKSAQMWQVFERLGQEWLGAHPSDIE